MAHCCGVGIPTPTILRSATTKPSSRSNKVPISQFQYQELAEGESAIRLLQLLPSLGKFDPIRCVIFHAVLDEATTPSYEALSYVWGNAQDGRGIEVSDGMLTVGRNLFDALQALRAASPGSPRTIWIDAVCINQADEIERAQQVKIMWKIYANAMRTIVWLGPADGDSNLIMSNFLNKETQTRLEARKVPMPRPAHYHGSWCGCHAGDFETWPPTEGFGELLKRSWFRRVWVIQEVAASKNLFIACGDIIIPSHDFTEKSKALLAFIFTIPSSFERPLVELIDIFRSWEATDPRDKVFALLGLSLDAHDGVAFPPDYTLSKNDLAQKLIQFYLPSCKIVSAALDLKTITFEVDGFIIRKISGRWSGSAERRWMFNASQYSDERERYNLANGSLCPAAAKLVKGTWEIFIMNEKKLPVGGFVCLLQGATRPSLLIRRGDEYQLDTLATPEPVHDGKDEGTTWTWMEAVELLKSETEGLVRFRLSWNPYSPLARHQISGYKVLYPDSEEAD